MPRQDARRDRQRIDAGIEHPETAGLPDPLLTRMPAADILLPDDIDAADMAFGEPGARRSDAGGVARMPRGEERRRGGLGEPRQSPDLRPRRAGRVFEQPPRSAEHQ